MLSVDTNPLAADLDGEGQWVITSSNTDEDHALEYYAQLYTGRSLKTPFATLVDAIQTTEPSRRGAS